jgi:hypothetical protein
MTVHLIEAMQRVYERRVDEVARPETKALHTILIGDFPVGDFVAQTIPMGEHDAYYPNGCDTPDCPKARQRFMEPFESLHSKGEPLHLKEA